MFFGKKYFIPEIMNINRILINQNMPLNIDAFLPSINKIIFPCTIKL